jgi:oligoribonuclease NrnB/cAMP/cGMP phosphodiesterase (DHH superfamily)
LSKILIVGHSQDLDGQAGMAICYKYARENIVTKDEDILVLPMTYGEEFNWFNVDLQEDLIIFVDFVLQPFSQMLIFNPNNLLLIDHHKTTIENLEQNTEFNPDGNIGNLDNKQSAAELAWEFFYPEIETPILIKMISYYDTWQKELSEWQDILAFQEGLKIQLKDFLEDKQSWIDVLEWSSNGNRTDFQEAYAQFLGETLKWGRKILSNKIIKDNRFIRESYFVTKFEGLNALAINGTSVQNSLIDSNVWKENGNFDIAIAYSYIGGSQNQYVIHLRTDRNNVDCSALAKKYKGGGHFSASGFQSKKLPFKIPINGGGI